jgi:hypothetical protein
MDILGILFDSQARVKILRLFLLNPIDAYDAAMVGEKSKVTAAVARREINILKKAGILMDKSFIKETPSKRKGKPIMKKRVQGVILKPGFPLLAPLKGLVISETPLNRDEISKRLRGVGKIKLLAISGIFIDEPEACVDVLIVGDGLKRRAIEAALRAIEAEIGHEISYGALETPEFLYRVSVYDKFVRDILDFRHDRVIDKLGVV